MNEVRQGQSDDATIESPLVATVYHIEEASDVRAAIERFARELESEERRVGIGTEPVMGALAIFAAIALDDAYEDIRTEVYLQAIDRRERECGFDSPCVTATLELFAVLLTEKQRFAEAERILRNIVERVERRTDEASIEVAWCYENLGDFYVKADDFDKSADCYRQAVERYQQYQELAHDRLAYALNSFAEVRKMQNRFDEAVALYESAYSLCEWYEAPGSLNMRVLLKNIAFVHDRAGTFDHISPVIDRIEKLYLDHLLPIDEFLVDTYREFATMCCNAGKCEIEAEALEQTIAIGEKLFGEDAASVMDDRQSLGKVYMSNHEYVKAESTIERALAIMRESETADAVARIFLLNDIAGACRSLGKELESIAYLQEAIERALVSPDIAPQDVILLQTNLARAYWSQNRLDAVEDALLKCLSYAESAFGRAHQVVFDTIHEMISYYNVQGHYLEAIPYQEQAVDVSIVLAAAYPNDPASEMTRLSRLHHVTGNLLAAEKQQKRAIAADLAAEHGNYEELAYHRSLLGDILTDRGEYRDAEMEYMLAQQGYESCGLQHTLRYADLLNCYARMATASGDLARGEQLYFASLDISRGFEHYTTTRYVSASALARIKFCQDNFEVAGLLYDEAIEVSEAAYGLEHPYTAIALVNRAGIFDENEPIDRAEALLRRALYIDERAYGNEHIEIATDLRNLAQVLRRDERYRECEVLIRRAVAICDAHGAEAENEYGRCLKELAALLRAMHRDSEADAYASQMFELSQREMQEATMGDRPLRIDFLS